MSGDPAPIIIVAERDTVLARGVEALGRFPVGQPWVLVDGIAVFLWLGSITRATADADTVARSQAALLDQLTTDEPTVVISGGEIQMPVGGGIVQFDVMDLNDEPLPGDLERRTVDRALDVGCGAGLLEDRVGGPTPARQPSGEGRLRHPRSRSPRQRRRERW